MSPGAAERLTAVAGRRGELLQTLVETARLIFIAEAASVALLDRAEHDFVFVAVAGQGDDSLVGARFHAGQGLAGTVAASGDPLVVDDLSGDPRFAHNVATETGYVPNAMMVAPLLGEDDVLGVLSVLDRGRTERNALQELELLVRFAGQAALAITVTDAAADAAALLRASGGDGSATLGRLARRADTLDGARRDRLERVLEGIEALVEEFPPAREDPGGLRRSEGNVNP
jgi:signal transduction protein with GAF and PtsI domain